jgi:hypothetical protein
MSAYREFKKRTINYLATQALLSILSLSLGTASLQSGFLSLDKQPEALLELTPKKKTASLQIQHDVPGSIAIQGWHQNHIAVSIQKYTHTDDDADRITTTLTQTEYGVITLAILENEALHKRVQVDITVHIPHHIATTIMAQNEVSITHTDNSIRVETEKGNVTTQKTRGKLYLKTNKGDIHCTESYGAINVQTERGNITIAESYQSIDAKTARGIITVDCARVPSTARIELSTKKGSLTLAVPESTNAHLIADTTRGTVTSNLLITIERHTMVLNSGTYQDLQRHIRGIIGQQETAEIKLSGSKDIHITTNDVDIEEE